MPMTALQSRLARAGIGIGVRETAFLAGVSPETITRIEKSESVKPSTTDRVASTYKFLGVIFIDDAEKPGLMIDLNRLAAVRSGVHDLEFYELRNDEVFGQLAALSAIFRMIDSGAKWTTKGWTMPDRHEASPKLINK